VPRLLPLLLIPLSLACADLSIDHVIVAGKDLQSMQAKLAAIGIPTEYGGRHSNHATEMALVSFPDGSYLELLAIQPDADPQAVAAYVWARQLQKEAGPCAWAARLKDIDPEVKRLRAAGVPVGQAVRGGRNRPDGTRLEWEATQVGEEPSGTYFPYLERDLTPRALRAFPRGKPTTQDFKGVATVVIAVRDLDAAIKRFRQAYDMPPPVRQPDPEFSAQLALLGSIPVILAAPLNAQSWLNGRLREFGEGPCAFILSRRSGQHGTVSKTRWFGIDVSWMDADKLGWRLGFE
jgi:hypothetical protein